MINLEIVKSPDQNTIAAFKYFQNQVYLGRSSGDLWINDANLSASHLMLEVIGHDLIIHAQKGVEFFLINGKRASSVKKIKINDEITIGQTVLKVLEFSETVRDSKKTILDGKLGQLINQGSPRLAVIERLTQLMKQ